MPLMRTRSRERGAILIISDGADTASDANMHDVRSALLRSDAFSYAIGIDPPARRAINTGVNLSALTEITNSSGGSTEVVHDTADLDTATAHIADELNKQYLLGYVSSRAPDGRYTASASTPSIRRIGSTPATATWPRSPQGGSPPASVDPRTFSSPPAEWR